MSEVNAMSAHRVTPTAPARQGAPWPTPEQVEAAKRASATEALLADLVASTDPWLTHDCMAAVEQMVQSFGAKRVAAWVRCFAAKQGQPAPFEVK